MARILVVDDDPDIVNLVNIRLRKQGHKVVMAGSGAEALAVTSEDPPDVAVLDVSMPGLRGLELCRLLRGSEGMTDLPVIFLSARVLPEDIEAGKSLGARYLTKPFVASALFDAVNSSLKAPDEP